MNHTGFTTPRRETRAGTGLRWIAALGILWLTLIFPDRQEELHTSSILRLPVELPVLILVLVLAPGRLRAAVLAVATTLLTALLILKVADFAVFFFFDRPVSFLADGLMASIAVETLVRTSGLVTTAAAAIGAVLLIVILTYGMRWAMRMVQRQAPRAPTAIAAGMALIVALATPAGTAMSSLLVRDHVVAFQDDLRAAETFRGELSTDAVRDKHGNQALTAFKGTDVLLIFVESYGRTAIDNPDYAPMIQERLRQFDKALADAGFSARSAWTTSPTYGGASYLAHGTFLSGLWVDDRQRYAQLLNSNRHTLIRDFGEAGWRTVGIMPLISGAWPEGDYFGYDTVYDFTRLGYAGRSFGYVPMPDQYPLYVLQSKELAPADRKPVMAEVVLTSSHLPWTPLPKFVPWDQIGSGQIFDTARTTESRDFVWRDLNRLHHYYAMSIDYVLETLASFIVTYARDNTVIIVLGDHQPTGFIADTAAREVPIHIIARDPTLLAALGSDWTPGMLPDKTSPIQPMSAMRERILRAFTPAGSALSQPPTP